MSLAPGTRLGAYEVVSLLGAGGMGEVYRARDTRLNRDVAVKILPEIFSGDADRLARFKREAQVLASLNHPHIAAIYGLEESSAGSALVLELVEGSTLADRIAQGPIPIDEALLIARQIANALEAAHEHGIIHRDLKPANIKITPDDKVKVLDFGLAKAVESAPAAELSHSPTLSMVATQAGVILGTAAYMSPEQANGRPTDQRSDIFAFGTVLYEMLTARQPFQGTTAPEILASILVREPDLTALAANLNPRIRELVERCLEKKPKNRWQAIGDVRAEIERIAIAPYGAPAPAAGSPRPLWRRAVPPAFAALATAALMITIAHYWLPTAAAPVVARFSFSLAEGETFTGATRQLVAISPDGSQIVYVANRRLQLRPISSFEPQPMMNDPRFVGTVNPAFSSDGRSIAFYVGGAGGGGSLLKIATTGGTPVTLCQATIPFGMSWYRDSIVFGQGADGIMRVSANGGKPEQIVSVKKGEQAHGPQMLPGGDAVLFTLAHGVTTRSGHWDKASIVVQSLQTGERKVIVEGGSDARYLTTGHLVYVLGGVVYALSFDPRTLSVTGGTVPVLEGVRRSNVTGAAQFSVSNTGALVYVPGPVLGNTGDQEDLALTDRAGRASPLRLPLGSYDYPRISPNGTAVAFHTEHEEEANVWIYELSGTSSMRRLTFGGNNRFPVWSPDARRVAFQSDREGDGAIFWQLTDGTGQAERLVKAEAGTTVLPVSWAPNSRHLLFEMTKGGTVSLWSLSLPDRKASPVDSPQSSLPINAAFSPDGRWVAYTSTETKVEEIYVQPFPPTGAKFQITKTRGHHPFWSPDGKELFYVPGPGTFAVVSIQTRPTFTFGNPVPLQRGGWQEAGPTYIRNVDILPDGKRFIGVISAAEASAAGSSGPEILVVLNWTEELKKLVPTN